jgi:hypothetical protein
MPANHDTADIGRPFQRQWKEECGKIGKGDGDFPETRKRNADDPFVRCTLECMCGSCSQGTAEKIRCDAYGLADDTVVSNYFCPYTMPC